LINKESYNILRKEIKSVNKTINLILNKDLNIFRQYIGKKRNYKIVAISYSNEIYQTQLQYNKKSAFDNGKVDEYYEYGPNDIDKDFREKNKDILSRKRGNGYWLWKPYIILKTLKEKLNNGDYLFYTDACIFYNNDTKILVNFLINNNQEMWAYRLDNIIEKIYTKRDAFILLGADSPFYTDTKTIEASIQIYKKSLFTEKFLEEYLYYSQDKRIITDDPNVLLLPNYQGFIENRHDQSVFSILIKKYGLVNSGKMNMDIENINKLKEDQPYIFCHYRRLKFINYEDLKQKCNISFYSKNPHFFK
jgi:hypothetical protein